MKVKNFDHITLTVTDLERSKEFYQNFFGSPSSSGEDHFCFSVGDGVFCIALSPKKLFQMINSAKIELV